MRKHLRLYKGNRGINLAELMITSVVLALLAIAVAPLLKMSISISSQSEARTSLKKEGQEALRLMARRLKQCKRLFVSGNSDFLGAISFVDGPSPALAGSQLPNIEATASLSPNHESFEAGSVGNSLFFAIYDSREDFVVADSGASTRTIHIDVYRFFYYYLFEESGSLEGKSVRSLWEWRSNGYVDYQQLAGIVDNVEKSNAISILENQGYDYAWDAGAQLVQDAIYILNNSGSMTGDSNHNFDENKVQKLVDPLTGSASTGYAYSISPNTGGGFETKHPVPQFGTASGEFPSGFEVVKVGPTSARQVLIRLVLVAAGPFEGIMSNEDAIVVTVRDVW